MERPDETPTLARQPAEELLPTVYAELRRLAAALLSRLPPGQTLTPTALGHEAYLHLVGNQDPGWEAGVTSSGPRRKPCASSSSPRPAARPATSTEVSRNASSWPRDWP